MSNPSLELKIARPYLKSESPEITQNDVRLALANEDTANLKQDKVSLVHEEITPGVLMAQGIEIEMQQ